jgi:hypothetical protein
MRRRGEYHSEILLGSRCYHWSLGVGSFGEVNTPEVAYECAKTSEDAVSDTSAKCPSERRPDGSFGCGLDLGRSWQSERVMTSCRV